MLPGGSLSDRVRPWLGPALIAVAAGIAALAGSFLAVGRQPAWVVAPFDAFVLAASPDALIRFAITTLGELGHQLAFATAIALAATLLGIAALPGVLAVRDGRWLTAVVLGAVLPGLATIGLTATAASAIGAGAGAGLVLLVAGGLTRRTADESHSPARRSVLGALATAVGVGATGVLIRGTGPGVRAGADGVSIPDDAREPVRTLMTRAQRQSLDVDGLEPLVSTDFYEVDINNVDPDVTAEDWSLSVTGAVKNEQELDFAALQELPFEDRFVTLRCVGDGLNGDQMDNALWGGVPVAEVLEMAEPEGDRVILHAADGYFNDFPLAALEPGLLAYRMNGRPLPRGHGKPVRALVPGHWGEVNVKWLTEIEVVDEDIQGYWEKRGWHGTGPVRTVAKLWQINYPSPGRVELAGHAYAGTRGIDAVEVSIGSNDEWQDAELSAPLPGDDVWRQWRFTYESEESHLATVRAVDGTGAVQELGDMDPFPSGAKGWVSKPIEPKTS
ncbi:MAG: molybdopterin-dependent oxidoreductase [Salinirussus sp.]